MSNNVRVLAGRKLNVLERGIVTSSSEDPLFPRPLIYDGRPSRPFRFSKGDANDHVTVDTCLTLDPGFESWLDINTPEKWTKVLTGGASVTRNSIVPDTGTYCCQLASPAINPGTAIVMQTIQVRAGETFYPVARAKAAPGGTFLYLYCRNRQTGRWLTTAGAWSATEQPWFSISLTTSYQTAASSARTVEGMDVCMTDLVDLELSARVVGGGGGDIEVYLDNYRLLPEIDFLSLHGHNIDASISVELRSSNDPTFASSTLRATLTKRVPAFYGILGSPVTSDQHWRVLFSGTNLTPISLGELVLGKALTLARRPDYGWEIKQIDPDVATETPTGEVYSYPQAKWARRVLGMQYKFFSSAEMEEQLREVFQRCRGRRHPLVIVPDDTRPEVLHGRIDRSWAAKRRLVNVYDDTSLVVSESPFEVATL